MTNPPGSTEAVDPAPGQLPDVDAGAAEGAEARSTPPGEAPPQPGRLGRTVRDRDVVLLSAVIVVAVLAVQGLTIVSPALNDAIGRPPTVIVFLVVVTVVVMARVALATLRGR